MLALFPKQYIMGGNQKELNNMNLFLHDFEKFAQIGGFTPMIIAVSEDDDKNEFVVKLPINDDTTGVWVSKHTQAPRAFRSLDTIYKILSPMGFSAFEIYKVV